METQQQDRSILARGLNRALRSRVAAILAYPHGVDRYLEQFDSSWSLKDVRAELVSARQQTPDSVTVQLRPNDNWQGFKAGQYLRLSADINGVRRTRCFSPANSVHAKDGLLELTCKIGPNSILSRHLAERAQPGDVLHLSQAEGEFALPGTSIEGRPARVLLISGGSGITPVLSMLRTLCDEGHTGRITFLHYCNRTADQLYADELAQLASRHPNVDLVRCYAQPNQGGELEGLFSPDQLERIAPDFRDAQTFLCGPPAMMQAVESAYQAAGIRDRLHIERFSAAPVVINTGTATGELRFARSERLTGNTGDTLLNQAEAAGLKPESGCRMGICHTCTCRKLSGQVRDTRNGKISEAGEEDIQICVSVPVGSVTLDI